MKILVTGGAGFIGSNIVRLLLERKHEVTVLDDLSTGYAENLKGLDVRFFEGSICDPDKVAEVMQGQDGVAHLAASVGNKKSIEYPVFDASSNVLGTINVLEAMRKHLVGRIVYSSSAGIFGEPQCEPVDEKHPCEPESPYGATKWCGEKICLAYMRMYNLRATCLRYFNVYGVNQRYDAYGNVIPIFVTKLLKGEPLTIYGDGEQTRDFINVRDVALANVLSLEKDSVKGPINVGTGVRITINGLAGKLLEISGRQVEIIHGPERLGDVRHCTANIQRFCNELGFSPSTDIQTHLADYFEWMQNR